MERKVNKNIYSSCKEYKQAEKLYKDKKYEEAYNIYISLIKKYGKVSKLYKRLIECLTKDYTYKENNKQFKKCYKEYVTTYKLIATKRENTIFDKKQEEYKNLKYKSDSKFLIILFFGIFGVHKFMEKKYIMGIIYLLTLGIFGLGVINDLVMDYATYEDDSKVDILRCLIAILVIVFGFIFYNGINLLFFILAAILITPIIFSKVLRIIPNFIKIIIIIILIVFGTRKEEVIQTIPTNMIGTWVTNNENTNFKKINISFSKTKIKFKDKKEITGSNDYNNNILLVTKNVREKYKFIYDKKNKRICLYNESNSCLIYFTKE